MSRMTATCMAGVVLPVFAMLAACETVPKPAADSTPPKLTWHVINTANNTSTTFAGNGHIDAKPDEAFDIILTASDPEGVSFIGSGGNVEVTCRSGDAVSQTSTLYKSLQQNLAPDPKGKVLTSIFLIRSVAADTTCPPGSNWAGTSLSLTGEGRNYYSGSTPGLLAIQVSP
jgi:hypothetical protein